MVSSRAPAHVPEPFWQELSDEDQQAFLALYQSLRRECAITSKDRRAITFHRELISVVKFLERSPDGIRSRALVAGVCFAGPVVLMDTRMLKMLLGRCKSSINGCFQNLGFTALRSKSKARLCVTTMLPTLQRHPDCLRQWTARHMSDTANVGFVSSLPYQELPEIAAADLMTEKGHTTVKQQLPFNSDAFEVVPFPKSISPALDFDLDQIGRPEGFPEFATLETTWVELKADDLLEFHCRVEPSFPPELNFALFDEIEAQ
jgi:hypothetical protein